MGWGFDAVSIALVLYTVWMLSDVYLKAFEGLFVFFYLFEQVDHKDVTHEKLLRFNRLWLTRFDADSLLIFSTGRSPELFAELAVRTCCFFSVFLILVFISWRLKFLDYPS